MRQFIHGICIEKKNSPVYRSKLINAFAKEYDLASDRLWNCLRTRPLCREFSEVERLSIQGPIFFYEERCGETYRTTFAEVCDYRTEIQTHEVEQSNETDDSSSDTTTVTETVLIIELTHHTPDEMRDTYHFTDRQNEYLTLLSGEDTTILWGELLGGFVQGNGNIMTPGFTGSGDGTLQWPLPVAGNITSPFGYRTDPISGESSYHSGTDISAPEGTPILAAAAGTVTIANATDSWGGSYGFHVNLDHGNGMETLYAHCSSICVTVGQQVQAGQVIAYVGHTGRATGNHLHFEAYIDGQRTDPTALVG